MTFTGFTSPRSSSSRSISAAACKGSAMGSGPASFSPPAPVRTPTSAAVPAAPSPGPIVIVTSSLAPALGCEALQPTWLAGELKRVWRVEHRPGPNRRNCATRPPQPPRLPLSASVPSSDLSTALAPKYHATREARFHVPVAVAGRTITISEEGADRERWHRDRVLSASDLLQTGRV